MARIVRRNWNPQIARGFFGTWAVLLTVAAVVVLIGQNALTGRITKVEHTVEHRVELCSTTVSCHRLLGRLLLTVRPSDIAKLRKRVGVRSVTHGAVPLARELARRHAARRKGAPPRRHSPPPVPREPSPGRPSPPNPPVSQAPSAPPAVATPPTPSVPVTPPRPHVPVPEPVPPVVEKPAGREGPLGLPCVKVAGIEVLCRPAG